jgi:hypothetical protein
MQNIADINPPLQLGIFRLVVSASVALLIVLGYLGWVYLSRMLALRRQKTLAKNAKPNFEAIILQALRQIEAIKQAVNTQQLSPKEAATQLSTIVRSTFDTTMNHRTVYQAKYEIAERKLEHITKLLDISYPLEFSTNPGVQQSILQLCDDGRKVVESCR